MSRHERPLLESFREVAALCEHPDARAVWMRRSNAVSHSLDFAELTGYTNTQGHAYPPEAPPQAMMQSRWRMWNDQLPYEQAEETGSAAYLRQKPPVYEGETYGRVTAPRLVAAFSRRFESARDIQAAASYFMDWMAEAPSSFEEGVQRAIANSLARWIQLNHRAPEHLANELGRREGAIAEHKVPYYVTQSLGKILIKAQVGGFEAKEIAALDDEFVAQTIGAVSNANTLEDRFWLDFGVRASGGIVRPAFLPLLHEKLSDQAMVQQLRGAKDLQLLSRAYITDVLKAHSKNPDRHTANSQKIIKAVRPTRSSQTAVDLRNVINVANTIGRQLSSRLDAEQQDQDIAIALRPADMMHVSDAFMRLLHVTRRNDLPPSMQVQQFEEDMYHAELVALLREGVVDPLRTAGHAALARLPHEKDLRAGLHRGRTMQQALAELRKKLANNS